MPATSTLTPTATATLTPAPANTFTPTPTPYPGLHLELDMDVTNGSGPCDPIDASAEHGYNETYQIAVCVTGLTNGWPISRFTFDVIYDDALNKAPEVADAGLGLDDNPDANAGAPPLWADGVGSGWDCSDSGQSYPMGDRDPLTGPGHGDAFLSCSSPQGPWTLGDNETAGVLALITFEAQGAGTDSLTIPWDSQLTVHLPSQSTASFACDQGIQCLGGTDMKVDEPSQTPSSTPTPTATSTLMPTATSTLMPTATSTPPVSPCYCGQLQLKYCPTDPMASDSDGDGLADGVEVNILGTNPLDPDTDSNGTWDGLEDPDHDGLFNVEEVNTYHTDPLKPDTDGDGLNDGEEVNTYRTDPLKTDTDGDWLSDYDELHQYGTDPLKPDTDGDGLKDGVEIWWSQSESHPGCPDPLNPDSDGDTLRDGDEIRLVTDPCRADTDLDGTPDGQEDADGDGLSNAEELNIYDSDPLKADTDDDGLSDLEEVRLYATMVHRPDTDGDGLSDEEEVRPRPCQVGDWPCYDIPQLGHLVAPPTNPLKADTDDDGLADRAEIYIAHLNPIMADTDGDGVWDGLADADQDGLTNADEINSYGTNPLLADTDEDRLLDLEELGYNADPLNPDSDLDGLADGVEVHLMSYNPASRDSDGDGTSDDLEDPDGDGLPNGQEVNQYHTDPFNPDSDGDGLSDGAEIKYRDPLNQATDWPSDYHEPEGTDPLKADTDGDGVPDGGDNCPTVSNPDQPNSDSEAIDNGPDIPGNDITVPYGDSFGDACSADADKDGLSNTDFYSYTDLIRKIDETTLGTDPLNQDTDGDRVVDGAEVTLGSDPLDPNSKPSCVGIVDSDRDCLPDDIETALGSDRNTRDTDGDGIPDGVEVKGWGTSPILRDTDYDGCEDDKEIVDINGDKQANIVDVMWVARMAFGLLPPHPALDINKDGANNILDVMVAVLNSTLVKPHAPCQ